MKNIYLTLLGACAIEILSVFVPLKEGGALKKYIRYIISLVVMLAIITPVLAIFKNGLPDKISKIDGVSYKQMNCDYIYIDDKLAYKANEKGEIIGNDNIFCDMYIKECAHEIMSNIEEAIHEKFGLENGKLKFGLSLDLRNPESIELIGVYVYTNSLPQIVKEDIYKYVKALVNTAVSVK